MTRGRLIALTRVAVGLALTAAVAATVASSATAQPPVRKPASALKGAPVVPTNLETQSKLDEWIVRRFRGAELLPDSDSKVAGSTPQPSAPRIEGTRIPDVRDTLVALHFNAAMWSPSLSVGALPILADPTGVASRMQGRVTARRAFRAPRKPGAVSANSGDWRIGWAYLVSIPARAVSAMPSGWEGWLLLDPPVRARAPVRPTDRPTDRSTDQSTDRPTDRSTDQSTDRSTDRSTPRT